MSFKTELENLAKQVAKKATQDVTPFTESIEALKVLSTLYGIMLKDKGKADDEPADEFTMADAAKMIEGHDGSGTPLRGRSGRRTQ